MEEIYARCDWCDTPISYGNASVSIDKNIQQVDRTDEDPDGIATVIQSDVVATLCADCGNRLNIDALQNLLSTPISKRRPTTTRSKAPRKKRQKNSRGNRFRWDIGDVLIEKKKKRGRLGNKPRKVLKVSRRRSTNRGIKSR